MLQLHTTVKLAIAGAVVAVVLALPGTPAPAQDATTSSATSTTSAAKKAKRTATPEMIAEAIQRSQARTTRATQSGRPEQFGSEEPFTYDPTR